MMENAKKMFEKKFLNPDGTVNKSTVAAFITLLILLVQQILAIFGVKFTGDWSQIVGAINTVLAILAAAGFVEGSGEVTVGGEKSAEVSAPETKQTGAQGK